MNKADKFNEYFDQVIDNKEIISNKELFSLISEMKQFKNTFTQEELKFFMRGRLSWLAKNGTLERVTRGIYRNSKFEHTDKDYYYGKSNETRIEIISLLNNQYGDKWSFTGIELMRELSLSDQITIKPEVIVNIRSSEKFEETKHLLKEKFNIELTNVVVPEELNIKLLAISKFLQKIVLVDWQIHSLRLYLEKNNLNPINLLDYLFVPQTNGSKLWAQYNSWLKTNEKLKINISKILKNEGIK